MATDYAFVSVFVLLFALATISVQAGLLKALSGQTGERGLLYTPGSMALFNLALLAVLGSLLGPLGIVLALVGWSVVALLTFGLPIDKTLVIGTAITAVGLGGIMISRGVFLSAVEIAESVLWMA